MRAIWLRVVPLVLVAMVLVMACDAPSSAGENASAPSAAPAPQSPPSANRDLGAAAGQGTGAADGSGDDQVIPDLTRKVIYTATMTIQAQDVIQAQAEAEQIVRSVGGYVAGSTLRAEGDRPIATVTLKVPADAYAETMSRLRGIAAKVDSENVSTQDVTEEYADLQAQLRNLEATEAQYLRLLEQANSIEDVLRVQQQLSQVRGQIERIKGRLQFLDRRVEYSTITLTIVPVATTVRPVSGWDLGFVVSRAWNASLQFWRVVAEVVITLVIFTWWLAIPIGIGIWILRRRRSQRPRESASAG